MMFGFFLKKILSKNALKSSRLSLYYWPLLSEAYLLPSSKNEREKKIRKAIPSTQHPV